MRYDKESNIINELKYLNPEEILILTDEYDLDKLNKCENIILSLINQNNWLDNSKSNMPPDFLNTKDKIMMEVMRVDDHVLHNKKNPHRQKESEVYNKLKDIVLEMNPNFDTDNIFINTSTNLKTEDDHSYKSYLDNFRATVNKHISKIIKYRKNHKDYKLCFFVFDESSGNYIEQVGYRDMNSCYGMPHFFWMDEAFVNCFLKADIDYFIWLAPYKYQKIQGHETCDLPKIIFYDLKHIRINRDFKLSKYNLDKMVSSEN